MNYVPGKRFCLPKDRVSGLELGYEICRSEGKVSFFYSDNGACCDVNRFEIPMDAREMEFLGMEIDEKIVPGAPAYYDCKGNLLKIGNR